MGDLSFAANSTGIRNIPPVLSSPTGTKTGVATATLTCASNMSGGTFYWYVSTSAAQPTTAALKAGTGAAKYGSQTGSTSNSVFVTGLSAATKYYAFFLHDSPTYGVSSYIASGPNFTTDSASSGNLTINITYDTNSQPGGSAFGGDATLQANFYSAVNEAVAGVESWFCASTPKTFSIQFGYGTVDNGAIPTGLAQSLYSINTYNIATIKSALAANAVTAVATSAASNFPSSLPSRGGAAPALGLTTPQAVMLGQSTDTSVNAYAGLAAQSNLVWSRSGTMSSGMYDAVGALQHEIFECMGAFRQEADHSGNHLYSMYDFFSYSSAGVHEYTQTTCYFSYDGGTTVGPSFCTSGGDAGDWAGIAGDARNASATPGSFEYISTVDKQTLDALGWQWTGT
jgi:hypothetical protein